MQVKDLVMQAITNAKLEDGMAQTIAGRIQTVCKALSAMIERKCY